MTWTWGYLDSAGTPAGVSQDFPSQADAETWIGESWRELLESGVASVTLLDDGRAVYGPMGLTPAG